jgi:hypothetical protein
MIILIMYRYAGFQFLTTVVIKSSVFWDVTPRSPLKVKRRFGGTHPLHLKGRRIRQARHQRESSSACQKMEIVSSSETSVNFYQITWRRIPGDTVPLFTRNGMRTSNIAFHRTLVLCCEELTVPLNPQTRGTGLSAVSDCVFNALVSRSGWAEFALPTVNYAKIIHQEY